MQATRNARLPSFWRIQYFNDGLVTLFKCTSILCFGKSCSNLCTDHVGMSSQCEAVSLSASHCSKRIVNAGRKGTNSNFDKPHGRKFKILHRGSMMTQYKHLLCLCNKRRRQTITGRSGNQNAAADNVMPWRRSKRKIKSASEANFTSCSRSTNCK